MDFHCAARIFIIICLFSAVLPSAYGVVTYENETLLLNTLQSGYKRTVRPSTPTNVFIIYAIRTLQSLNCMVLHCQKVTPHRSLNCANSGSTLFEQDITEQSMSTTGWLSLFWHDPRLVWTATDYSNITAMDADWVWRPEFMVSNTVEGIFFGGYDNDKVRFRVFSTGMVRWIMPLPLTTTCDVDIAKFPFDSQSCRIEIMFWGLNTIDLAPNITTEISDFAYIENAEWQYDKGHVSTELFPLCCPESIAVPIYVNLSFTRLKPFYVINLIVPAMLFSVCMVLTFLLPTQCGERLGYSLTILLSYTVLMTITSSMMPTTSKQTPHINMYLLILLVLCSTSVLNVVVSVKMFYLKSKPPRLLQIIGRRLCQICFFKCCKSKDEVVPVNLNVSEKNEEKHKIPFRKEKLKSEDESFKDTDELEEVTWQQLAALQDRLCFYLYALTCLILIIVFVLSLLGTV